MSLHFLMAYKLNMHDSHTCQFYTFVTYSYTFSGLAGMWANTSNTVLYKLQVLHVYRYITAYYIASVTNNVCRLLVNLNLMNGCGVYVLKLLKQELIVSKIYNVVDLHVKLYTQWYVPTHDMLRLSMQQLGWKCFI